mmetsp:Transcript_18143/g.64252  ORF Transcript_18143/g.64252 Transcript_18143/m.64252 type:complete len:205 (-) Transcript_18143:164-778(-)
MTPSPRTRRRGSSTMACARRLKAQAATATATASAMMRLLRPPRLELAPPWPPVSRSASLTRSKRLGTAGRWRCPRSTLRPLSCCGCGPCRCRSRAAPGPRCGRLCRPPTSARASGWSARTPTSRPRTRCRRLSAAARCACRTRACWPTRSASRRAARATGCRRSGRQGVCGTLPPSSRRRSTSTRCAATRCRAWRCRTRTRTHA